MNSSNDENSLRKRLFQASSKGDFFDTPEEQKDSNVIDRSMEQISHADKKVPETCLDKRLFQTHLCFKKDTKEQIKSRKIDALPQQVHRADGKASETCFDKRLFHAQNRFRKNFFDISQKQKVSNEINTPTEYIQHASRRNWETCFSKQSFQAPHCIREDCFDTFKEQKNSNETNTLAEHIQFAARRSPETCFRKQLFQTSHCVREDCFESSKEQKNSNEIKPSAGHIQLSVRKAPETSFGKRLFQAPQWIRKDCFNTYKEQKDSNEIDASAKLISYAPKKAPGTPLGKRLFQAPHIREDCLETSLEQKESRNNALMEQVHHTTRRASKTHQGKQLFQEPHCVQECFSGPFKKPKDSNDKTPAKKVYLADRKAPETCSGKRFLTSHFTRHYSETSKKRNDSSDFNTLAKPVSYADSCFKENCFNASKKLETCRETDACTEHFYNEGKRSPEACFSIKLFQPYTEGISKSSIHCVRDADNSDEQNNSNETYTDAKQFQLAHKSTPKAPLGKKLFHSQRDVFDTCRELKHSIEFDIPADQVYHATKRISETCLDKRLSQAPHCDNGDLSDISEDENESDMAALQVYLETKQDMMSCLRKMLFRAHNSFRGKFSEISLQQNVINEVDPDTEQIHQAIGSDREASGNEEGTKESWGGAWKACHFRNLPRWLQDNDFLLSGHRPPLETFGACFRSAFRIHTETVNIWTHLAGCALFVGIAAHFMSCEHVTWRDKLVFGAFLASVILCLGTSTMFHAVSCHSEPVCKLFGKLDYCGIATLITGSFVPWLHYGFYCERRLRVFYCTLVATMGTVSASLSLYDKFGEPHFRHTRAALFAGFGLSGVVPTTHYLVSNGWVRSVGWLALMAALYLVGAAIYASRVPERFFPGRCDILFQSHQIFHVLVVAAALVHYHGTKELAYRVLTYVECASAAD